MPEPGEQRREVGVADAEIERRLVDAVQDGRLRPLLDDVARDVAAGAGEPPAVARVRAAVEAIDRTVADERSRILGRLAAEGIAASIDDERPDRPLRSLTIELSRADVGATVTVLEDLGYRLAGPTGAGARRALLATRTGVELTGGSTMAERLSLHWPGHRLLAGRRGRLLIPSDDDLRAAAAVPGPLWWLAVALRLVRLPARVLSRGRRPPHLGPFLGTPDELIVPLLAAAGVGPDDHVADLGCGDGRILIEAARQLGCRGRGIETDPELVALARRAVERAGLADQVDIEHGDASTARLDGVSVAVAFLPVDTVATLVPGLLDRLATGARLVAHEQQRLVVTPPPDRQTVLATPGGITVAHLWHR